MYFLFTNGEKGYLQNMKIELGSDLQDFVDKNLVNIFDTSLHPSRPDSAMFIIKETNSVKNTDSISLDSTALIKDLAEKDPCTDLVIQPYFCDVRNKGNKAVTRVFFQPPKIHVFNVQLMEFNTRDSPGVIARAKDCVLVTIEEQCRHLYSVIFKQFFLEQYKKLDSIVFDFIQPRSGI